MHGREMVKRLGIVSNRIVYALELTLQLLENKKKKLLVVSQLNEVLAFYTELEKLIPHTGDNSEIGNIKARLTRARRGVEELITMVELGHYGRANELLSLNLLPASKRFQESIINTFSLEPNA